MAEQAWVLVLVRYCPRCQLDYPSDQDTCPRCGQALVDKTLRAPAQGS